MSVLWQKNTTSIDETLQDFMAGEDVLLDQVLLPFDILASIAHVNGLKNIQVLSEVEASQIITELNALAQEFDEDEFLLDNRFEDGHSAIEFYLTEKLGDVDDLLAENTGREDGLLTIAEHGVIFAPGSAGTIQEIFMDACQNHYGSLGNISPMVFLNEAYWTETKPVYPLLKELAKGRAYEALLTIADDEDEVIDFILSHPPVPMP